MIVLAGSPGVSERARNPLLHHKVKGFETQFEVFQKITVASAVLDRPETAFSEIDRVLEAAVRYKRPVYLELPRDQVQARQVGPHRPPEGLPPSDPDALREAIDEAAALLTAARRPVILADVEIHRFGLQDELLDPGRIDRHADRDDDPGQERDLRGTPALRRRLRGGDGAARGDRARRVGRLPADARLLPDRHQPGDLDGQARSVAVHRRDQRRPADQAPSLPRRAARRLHPRADRRASSRWRERPCPDAVAARSPSCGIAAPGDADDVGPCSSPGSTGCSPSTPSMTVIADIGDSLFGAADLEMHRQTEFLSPAYYTSMGFGVPAAVGASMANPDARILVIVGDGAFQMTGMELSTIARHGLNPIVVVLNNHGYTTERFLLDGPFNDIHELGLSQDPRGGRGRAGARGPDRRRARCAPSRPPWPTRRASA